MEESCLNCARKAGCLLRSTTIFQLFISTGRYDMVPEAKEHMNIRASCTNWKLKEEQQP